VRASVLFYYLLDLTYFFMCLFGCLGFIVIVVYIVIYLYLLFKEVNISKFFKL